MPMKAIDDVHGGRRPRILALTGHPVEAAGARYRVIQFIPELERRGFDVDHQSFFSSEEYAFLYKTSQAVRKVRALVEGTLRRTATLARLRQYDAVLMHIWLHPITFPPFDIALRAAGVPVVYDFDDPYYAASGSLGDRLRDRNFTPRLMRTARHVIAGSEYIAEFVRKHNPSVEVLPTAIDTDRFAPRDFERERNPRTVIGWVGSQATAPFLAPIYPVIQRLAREHDFVFRVVGAGTRVDLPGVDTEWVDWKLANEVANFRDLDIGLYPLLDNEFTRGKHGFKLNQYMATGVPTVASAIGLNPQVIQHGENAFLASTPDEWYAALSELLRDEVVRRRVGRAGRGYVVEHASVRVCADRLAVILSRLGRGESVDGG